MGSALFLRLCEGHRDAYGMPSMILSVGCTLGYQIATNQADAKLSPGDRRALIAYYYLQKRYGAAMIECKRALSDADAFFRSMIEPVDNCNYNCSFVEAAWTHLEIIQNYLARIPRHLSWILPDGSFLELN